MADTQASENLWNTAEEKRAADLLREVSMEEGFWIPMRVAEAIIRKWAKSLAEVAT